MSGGSSGTGDEGARSPRVGLCASCRHARRIRNRRGSTFFFCERSRTDDGYPRYPRLPVRRCPGHERGPADPEGDGEGRSAEGPDGEAEGGLDPGREP